MEKENKKLKDDKSSLEKKIKINTQQISDMKNSFSKIEKKYINQINDLKQNMLNKGSYKQLCNEFIKKMENELIDFDYFIDKRNISDLIVKIFEKDTSEMLRTMLKETIASIMKLNNEDRIKMNIEPLLEEYFKKKEKVIILIAQILLRLFKILNN